MSEFDNSHYFEDRARLEFDDLGAKNMQSILIQDAVKEAERELIEEIEGKKCSDKCEFYSMKDCEFIVSCTWWQQLKQKRGK